MSVVVAASATSAAFAQSEMRPYAGALVGVSTLSADGRAATAPDAAFSLYQPENGPALSVLGGIHVTHFISVQATYVWNRNDLTLLSSLVSPQRNGFYEQERSSQQHLTGVDTLLFVRHRESRVRPYMSGGIAVVRFSSDRTRDVHVNGLGPPVDRFRSTRVAVRVAVGIDIRLGKQSWFRYAYGETLSANPVSAQLMPMGQRRLGNFQSLFGWVWQP
jgi:Outer membrane protein beta-barrel domain